MASSVEYKASTDGRGGSIEQRLVRAYKGAQETVCKMVQTRGEGEERREFTAPLAAKKRLICQEKTGFTTEEGGPGKEGAGE